MAADPTRTSASSIRRGAGAASDPRFTGSARSGCARSRPGIRRLSRSGSPRRASTPTPGCVALLRGDGYTAARFFYDMVAPTLDGVVAPPMPDGIELRPVTRDQYRAIWDASAEAFRDHWGEQEWTRGGLDPLRCRPGQRRPALLAHRLGRRRGGRRDRHDRAGRGERALRPRARLRLDGLRAPPVASPRPGAGAARRRRSSGRARRGLHLGVARRRHRLRRPGATDLYRSLGFVPERDVHGLAQADLARLSARAASTRSRIS